MSVAGPDFVALQVRNLEEAAHFYEFRLGLHRAVVSPPGAVVFDTTPIPFAVREPLPGVDLNALGARPGLGVALWLRADDAQALHDALEAAGIDPGGPSTGPSPDVHLLRARRLRGRRL